MTFRHDLSPIEHVARREALAQIARSHEMESNVRLLAEAVIMPLLDQFADGHRLDGRTFEGLVVKARSILSGFGPPMLIERRRHPTRAKPKGEEHEFLTAMRCASEEVDGPSGYEMIGVRFCISRRRMVLAYEANGVFITKHALERSIERGMASWSGRLAEVEDAVLDNLGLIAAWRRSFETGKVATPQIVLPYQRGLILGTLGRNASRRMAGHMTVSGSRCEGPMTVPNPLLVHPMTDAATACVDTILCTVIDEDLLRIEQVDLRDALLRFRATHKALLADVTASGFWRSVHMDPPPSQEALSPLLDGLADEIAALLRCNDAQDALIGRRAQDWPDAMPIPAQAEMAAAVA